jgi:sensor c-di-GMP phosphodiesterase-like protein
MINYLQEHDIKMAYLERALELPARTVNRWKTTDCSAAPLALLRIIRTYPWILEVADADYDESVSSSKLLEQAAKVLAIALERNKINTDYSKVDANTMSVTITTKPIYKMVSRFETGSIGEHSL